MQSIHQYAENLFQEHDIRPIGSPLNANMTCLVNVIASEYWKNLLQYHKINIRHEVESLFELILRREGSDEWNEVICFSHVW